MLEEKKWSYTMHSKERVIKIYNSTLLPVPQNPDWH